MSKLLSLLLLLCIVADSYAQKTTALSKVMTLKIEGAGGANGANVAWYPLHKKYYAAMAGNIYYPMTIFTKEGKILSDTSLKTMFDVRGLWFNTTTNTLQANGFKDFGLGEYKLDDKDVPVSVTKLSASGQPDEQAAAAYDAKRNRLYFYDHESSVIVRRKSDGAIDTIPLHLGAAYISVAPKHTDDTTKDKYNQNNIVYVNKKKVGLLNVTERRIELYSTKNGLLKRVLTLPADAPVEQILNFSYSNNIYWLFDKKKREWRGYQ
jgi:hypothetical protein